MTVFVALVNVRYEFAVCSRRGGGAALDWIIYCLELLNTCLAGWFISSRASSFRTWSTMRSTKAWT